MGIVILGEKGAFPLPTPAEIAFINTPSSRGDKFEAAGKIVKRGVHYRVGSKGPDVVVFGSSHSRMHGAAIEAVCKENGLGVAFLTVSGMSALDNKRNQSINSERF